jgi:hypothetical protein
MNCDKCRSVVGQPIALVRLYIKNKPSRMNSKQEKYSAYGWVCPQCQVMKRIRR